MSDQSGLSAQPGERHRLHSLLRTLKRYALHPRLLLALKTALAAGLSWFIALQMPGVAAEYPYYAPLGALVSMYPTVAGTAKLGLQTMVGLSLGIGLAYLGVYVGGTDVFTVGFVVGMGVLLAGTLPRIGGGAQWIPTAGLFVLVIGGNDIENYSAGYLIQMIIGVAVGLTINTLIFPPLNLNDAVIRMAGLRRTLAAQLQDMGAAMDESWPPDQYRWANREAELDQTSRQVREAVQYAELSSKANMRKRLHPRDLNQDYRRLQVLEQTTFQVEDVTTVLHEAIWGTSDETAIPPGFREPLRDALTAVGDLLDEWTTSENDDEQLARAHQALDTLSGRLHQLAADELVGASASITMSLRRIIRVVTPQLNLSEHDGDTGTEGNGGAGTDEGDPSGSRSPGTEGP